MNESADLVMATGLMPFPDLMRSYALFGVSERHLLDRTRKPDTVRKVEDERNFGAGDMKVFFEFPWTVYKNDPNWLPPLLSTRRKLLDKSKIPPGNIWTGNITSRGAAIRPSGRLQCLSTAATMRSGTKRSIGSFFFECLMM